MTEALLALALGLALDALVGDPVSRWHPVRLLGSFAAASERVARAAARDQGLAGALAWLAVAGGSGGLCYLAWAGALALHPALGVAAGALMVWASIAPKDLAAHALRVRLALAEDESDAAGAWPRSPERGRRAVSMLVGRDTSALDAAGVARACVESVAESSIDGAAAPLFWAAILGPWAAFAYRAVNTMDSMFGHKDERYLRFGLVPARADDAANWLPARLSSALACALAPLAGGDARGAFRSFRAYRLAHESPNAGHPEAAYAGALGLRLGGPSRYAEGVIDKPWMNPGGGEAEPGDIAKAVRLMRLQTAASAALFALAAWLGRWALAGLAR